MKQPPLIESRLRPPVLEKKRYHDLDALRAFAMLLGIVLHGVISFFPFMDPRAQGNSSLTEQIKQISPGAERDNNGVLGKRSSDHLLVPVSSDAELTKRITLHTLRGEASTMRSVNRVQMDRT